MSQSIKDFINNFDTSNPDWSNLPPGFPKKCDLGGLNSDEIGKFNSICGLHLVYGPKNDQEKSAMPKSGGYRQLKSYQNAEIVHDFTVEFIKKYISYKSRTRDQMEQAARSGKQNIAEGSKRSGTSKKTELMLVDVARASLAELLEDYRDYLRQHNLPEWNMNDERAKKVRNLVYVKDKSFRTYEPYMAEAEQACNAMLCLINQTTFLLDKQIQALEQDLIKNGDYNEHLKRFKRDQRSPFAHRRW